MHQSLAAIDLCIMEASQLAGVGKERQAHTDTKVNAAKPAATPTTYTPPATSASHFLVPPSLSHLSLERGVISGLTVLLNDALAKTFPAVRGLGFESVMVTRCTGPQAATADLQCNSAMNLFTVLKKAGNTTFKKPQEVAQALITNLPQNTVIEKVVVSGVGFINISLVPTLVEDMVLKIARNGPVAPPLDGPIKVAVDFSSPNIAKEMHVGHLRSTIIGDTICRILEFCGCDVLRINHVGDWGTQFGMLIQYLKETYPNWRQAPPDLRELTTFYKAAKARFDKDGGFREKARLNVPLLQSGDAECREIWHLLCAISRFEFKKIYSRLQVRLEEVGESFYNPGIPGVLQHLQEQKLAHPENGALLMTRDNWQCPLILRKSDGGFGYDSTDIAAIHYRLKTLKAQWLIYITDVGQRSHFGMIFDAARDAGWVGEAQLDHVGFGLVCGKDGKRFKTRSGETVRLVDLLDECVMRMEATLQERKNTGKTDLSEEDIKIASAHIGYGAIKYMDLRNNPTTNYTFSYERMLDTRGDTAVYLLFAYARLVAIIRKCSERGANIDTIKQQGHLALAAPCERVLALEILQFPDVVVSVLHSLQPNRLCEYLYNLCDKFTGFITELQVLGSPEQASRLLLCEATRRTMAQMFELLGIHVLERM